ncbi:uncharacterized protein LOC132222418 [Myotis daubentonii]|uniref:uncharacterized protein LOC132222418 n=1 Tax=Myotis daubentonii TaxID=98922 RepID=UPI0028731780|nr:uncharacterized protein LOC132222418 [Myotis daubentonii]
MASGTTFCPPPTGRLSLGASGSGTARGPLRCLEPPPAFLTCPSWTRLVYDTPQPPGLIGSVPTPKLGKGREPAESPRKASGDAPSSGMSVGAGVRGRKTGRRPADRTGHPCVWVRTLDSGARAQHCVGGAGNPASRWRCRTHRTRLIPGRLSEAGETHPGTRRGADLRAPDGTRGVGKTSMRSSSLLPSHRQEVHNIPTARRPDLVGIR